MLREKLKDRVVLVGIAGDSGSGKTTFARGIEDLFGGDIVRRMTLDDYHIYDREAREKLGITPLNPEANDLKLAETHLKMIKSGRAVEKPTYDHSTGTFGEWELFEPAPIVIVEGLHTFYDGLRELMDFKIFVDPARIVKRKWKIKRDVMERGYDRDKVVEEIIRREPDYKRYIDFQKVYADVVVKIYPTSIVSGEMVKALFGVEETYRVRLIFRSTGEELEPLSLTIDLAEFLRASGRDFSLSFYTDYYYARRSSFVEVDGFLSSKIFAPLLDSLAKEVGRRIAERKEEYVNAVEFAKFLVCWKLVEYLKSIL